VDGAVLVVEESHVPKLWRAVLRATRRLHLAVGALALDARIAEDALLGLAALPVVVDLLVRTAGDAHPPAAALVLVDQYNTVLFALVDRTARTCRHAGRVEAVLTQPRQIHHEGVFELAVDIGLHVLEVDVAATLGKLGAEYLFPVGTPLNLLHTLARNQRARPRGGLVLALLGGMQMLVVEGERLVVVVDLRQIRVGEDVRQHPPLAADARLDPAILATQPAAPPLVLVLPFLGIANAGLGLDVVEPGVLDTFTAGPDVLAGHRAGVTADALVEVEDHAYLRTNLHFTASCS
jgi:hypothetical protein